MDLKGKTVYFLRSGDTILSGDICRPLFDNSSPWVEKPPMTEWRKVRDEIPFWVDKTLDEFHKKLNGNDYNHMYEIIRYK